MKDLRISCRYCYPCLYPTSSPDLWIFPPGVRRNHRIGWQSKVSCSQFTAIPRRETATFFEVVLQNQTRCVSI